MMHAKHPKAGHPPPGTVFWRSPPGQGAAMMNEVGRRQSAAHGALRTQHKGSSDETK